MGFGSYDLALTKSIIEGFSGSQARFAMSQYNEFELNLRNTEEVKLGVARAGRVERVTCLQRGDAVLPLTGYWRVLLGVLKRERDAEGIYKALVQASLGAGTVSMPLHFQVLEAMLSAGWVTGKLNKWRPILTVEAGGKRVRSAAEAAVAAQNAKTTIAFNLPEAVAEGA